MRRHGARSLPGHLPLEAGPVGRSVDGDRRRDPSRTDPRGTLVTILCYHTVDPRWQSPMAVSPAEFDRHCRWLATHRDVVPLDRALATLETTGQLPGSTVALTFDDGLDGVHRFALPILRRYRLPATVFVVGRSLLPDDSQPVDWVDDPPTWPLRTMGRDQLLDWLDAGLDVQSHSLHHRDLTELAPSALAHDLLTSREVLHAALGVPAPLLAYPRGRHDERVRAATEQAGYVAGLALPDGPESGGRWAVPRVGVHGHNGVRTVRMKTSPHWLRLRAHPVYPRLRSLARR